MTGEPDPASDPTPDPAGAAATPDLVPVAPLVPEGRVVPEGATTSETTSPPAVEPPAVIPLATTRQLLSAAFDLLGRSSTDMRRASFYIGSIVLGTVGPFALAAWAVGVAGLGLTTDEVQRRYDDGGAVAFSIAGALALVGLIVAAVESRNVAAAILGGRLAGRPVTPRQALARSRTVFWRTVVAGIIVGIPLLIAEAVVGAVVDPVFGSAADLSVITTTLVTATIGAPFAYVLSGVVLGDVDPVESVRRSFRVFQARKLAAAIVVTFETVAVLLIFLGVEVGLDLVIRVMDALGLGIDSGPLGLAVITAGIVAATFAFGTLLFTVLALTIAPQVVMFVGLTHATIGLDSVRAGGGRDPDVPDHGGRPRMRTWTRPMLGGFVVGALTLALAVSRFSS